MKVLEHAASDANAKVTKIAVFREDMARLHCGFATPNMPSASIAVIGIRERSCLEDFGAV